MNEQLQQKAAELLDRVIAGIDKGVELVPGLTEEYLWYFILEEIPYLQIPLLIVFLMGVRYAYKMLKKYYARSDEDFYLGICAGFVLLVCFSVVTTCSFTKRIKNLMQIKVAPKAYLIEKIRGK